ALGREGPDLAGVVVAEDVASLELGVQGAPVDVAADDAASLAATVGVDGRHVESDQTRGLGLGARNVALAIRPLVIASLDDLADLFLGVLPDVAEPYVAGDGVERHAVRAANSNGKEFHQTTALRTLPGVVVRNAVAVRVAVGPAGCRGRDKA